MMEQGIDNGVWHTMFLVCGAGIDPDDLTRRLGFKPTAFVRAGEIPVPTVDGGSDRSFDSRLSLDRWTRRLSRRQLAFPLAAQLHFWIEKLAPAASALRYLRSIGYWTVIDCQVARMPSSPIRCLQFRLPAQITAKMRGLAVDWEFAVRFET